MNIELLRKIQKEIAAHADGFDMSTWFSTGFDACSTLGAIGELIREKYNANLLDALTAPACGTTACLAGWAIAISTPKQSIPESSIEIIREASRLLRIPVGYGKSLFDVTHWPSKYRNSYNAATMPQERAAVAVAYIDHFILTNGAE